MDNREFLFIGEGFEEFKEAMTLAFKTEGHAGYGPKTATHYSVTPEGFAYYWTNPEGKNSMPLPYPMEMDEAITFAWGWLKQAPYPEEPDHDGSNGKGFKLSRASWGHVMGTFAGIILITPEWAMYGK